MKYQNAKIYKIVNSIDKLIYVGSTIETLNIRFSKHKSRSKRSPNIKLYKHFAKLGAEHFKIILIKNYPCAGKTELAIEEERYKIRLNAQLNTRRAHQTAEQRKKYRKEWDAQNYQNNRVKINLKQNERILCKVCGKMYTRHNKSRHCKSRRHQKCVQLNQSKKATDAKYEKYVQFDNLI
jgi:hypothetical protein